ncbi:Adenosine 5'-monophosphoramidase [Lecanora helva]
MALNVVAAKRSKDGTYESMHIVAVTQWSSNLGRGCDTLNRAEHALVIPKTHGAKLTDIPDEQLQEIMPVAKRLASATGAENYNILQNNGRLAHQVVDHVHFHMGKIPKPNEQEGLGIGWPAQETDMDELKKYFESIKSKM